MTIGRIQIDFTLNDGEDIEAFLEFFGDIAINVLDPHEEGEDCTRWVSIEGCECEDDDLPMDINVDEIAEFLDLPDDLRDNADYN